MRDIRCNYEKAEYYFKESLRIDPFHVEAYLSLGDLMFNYFSDYESSELFFQSASKLDPDNKKAFQALKIVQGFRSTFSIDEEYFALSCDDNIE